MGPKGTSTSATSKNTSANFSSHAIHSINLIIGVESGVQVIIPDSPPTSSDNQLH